MNPIAKCWKEYSLSSLRFLPKGIPDYFRKQYVESLSAFPHYSIATKFIEETTHKQHDTQPNVDLLITSHDHRIQRKYPFIYSNHIKNKYKYEIISHKQREAHYFKHDNIYRMWLLYKRNCMEIMQQIHHLINNTAFVQNYRFPYSLLRYIPPSFNR
eukprot:869090_1